MAKGFFDYIADDSTAIEPPFECEEVQEEEPAEQAAENTGDAKEILAEMIASSAPLSDLIVTALQEVGRLTNDAAWADKQCRQFMQRLTPENIRALDLLSWQMQAQDLAKQEKAIIAQIKRQQEKHKAIGAKLDGIAIAANWPGELLSVKDLYTPIKEEPAQDPGCQQMTLPGAE